MKHFIRLLVLTIIISSCYKNVFVPDTNNNLIPEYSEVGRNVAGALINDTAWRCQLDICFACVIWNFYILSSITGDSTTFRFQGAYTSNSKYFINASNYNVQTDFNVVVKGLKIENQDSLLKLNNKTFILDSTNNYVSIAKYYQPPNNKGFGSFTITKVQKGDWQFGDGSPNNPKIYLFIVSGRFNFKVQSDREYLVKDGRFDMQVYLNGNYFVN